MLVKKVLKVFLGIISCFLIAILVIALLPARTPKIKDENGRVIPNSIAEINKLKVGGVDQYLMIRGNNINNPVILFVHGGPGQAEMAYIREYQKELEEKFVVVRWDQRGAGLSYSKDIPKESINTNQFVSDADEITDYLRKRFNKAKIFIAGHSWGTVIGTLAVKNNPEKYLAYIGIGQYVDAEANEKISYDFALSEAKKQNNIEAVNELEKIGPPPYKTIDDVKIQRKWLGKLGGIIKTEPKKGMMSSILLSPEYTLSAKLNYNKAVVSSIKSMFSEVFNDNNVDFLKDIKELKVPVYFFIGKYDYTTPFQLVEKFYDQLEAPKKDLIWFEKSGHLPQLEENENFNKTLIRVLEANIE